MNIKLGLYYIGWFVITLISFSALAFIPADSIFSKILPAIGVSGILTILIQSIIQFWRDRLSYERNLSLQRSQQDFTVGIASKMAEIAFEKHIKFSEEYIEAAYNALQSLGSADVVGIDKNIKQLSDIRKKYSPWLTEKIDNKLIPFEHNFREVSFGRQIIGQRLPPNEASLFIDKMRVAIDKLLKTENPVEKEGSIADVIETLRDMLGIKKLVELREQSFKDAVTRISKKEWF